MATTIGDVADRAGVSAATVYAVFQSKAGIVTSMIEEMEESAEIGPRLAELFSEEDPRRQLRLFVGAHCALFAAGSDVLRAAAGAAGHAEVAALAERGDAHRRRVLDELVLRWAGIGVLRKGLSSEEAADRMWLLTTVEGFLTASDRLGWSVSRYEDWLVGLLEREVLESGSS